jgi:hypothetical protein
MGEVQRLLRLEIQRDCRKRAVKISQSKYIEGNLACFRMAGAHKLLTNIKLCTADSNNEVVTNIPYQEVIGSLIYAAIGTQPDISYAVQVLSQYNTQLTATH